MAKGGSLIHQERREFGSAEHDVAAVVSVAQVDQGLPGKAGQGGGFLGGAGPGYAARAARARGAHVAAIDLSADMLACARLADPLLSLVRADAGTLPVAGGAFTAVVAGFFLPHLADPAAGTAELARALAPGGWLAVSIWDAPARARHTGLLADAIADVTGTPPPTPAVPAGRLRELLQAAGLDHAECSTLRWVHPVPSAQALWDGLLASPVAAAAAVLRATPAIQRRIRERFLTLAAALTDAGGTVRLPVSAVISAAQRPPAHGPRGYRPTTAASAPQASGLMLWLSRKMLSGS